MGKKSKKKVLTFEEFASRVMKLVRHLKIVIDELERQRQRITQLERTIENLKTEIDTLKAKISGKPIERKPTPALPMPPEPTLEPTPPSEPQKAKSSAPIEDLLPEFTEVPSPDEVSAPSIEEVLPEIPEVPSPAEVPELPTPEVKPKEEQKVLTPPTPPSPTPTPTPEPEPSAEDYSDLDKYLDKLDQIVEQIGVPEIPEPGAKEDVVPEISPEAGESGTTVSPDELKKKKKDILKALTELESA